MTDTPTTQYGLRQQGLGTNTNLWGDPNLNEVIAAIAQILGKVKSISISGDYTITSTNYVTTADNKNAGWKFTGTLTATATITVPTSDAIFPVDNSTTGGYSVTVKTSAGTGITVPNGRIAWLRCDGVNVVNAFPTHMGTTFTPSLPGDAANVNYVDTAIANATVPAAAGTILVSGGDTTAGYASQKFTTSIATATTTQLGSLLSAQLSIDGAGGNEKLKTTFGAPQVGGFLDGGSKSAAFTPSQGTAYDVDCTSNAVTVQLSSMTSVQLGQEIKINKFGTNDVVFIGTVNGAANLTRGDNFNAEMRYSGASWGWNLMAGAVKSIQKGTIALSGVASNTATITSVSTSKSAVFHNGQAFGTTTGLNASQGYLELTNATTVTATRVDAGNTLTIAFTVVEYY